MSDDISVHFRTVQGTTIKCLIESMKEVLNDVNIRFVAGGMKVTAMDGNKCACVHITLDADKFEVYTCNSLRQRVSIWQACTNL